MPYSTEDFQMLHGQVGAGDKEEICKPHRASDSRHTHF